MHHVESDLERFLARLVPGIDQDWKGATADELAALEAIAGRPLPPFYRWFLTRMGRDMGALAYASMDFSPARILACYQEEIAVPEPRYLLIGYETNEVVPMHLWYDLDQPNRDDALVMRRGIDDPLMQLEFETLREMLAWKALLSYKIQAYPYRCEGAFRSDGPDVYAQLDSVIDAVAFERPIPVGRFCGIYDRPDAAMVCSVTPRDSPEKILFFELAAEDPGSLRKILGVIATKSGLEVQVDTWDSPPS